MVITAFPVFGREVSVHAADHENHPACGASCTHSGTHESMEWMPFTITGGDLASGNYYLTDDVTLTGCLKIPAGNTVNLCLHGHKIKGGWKSGNMYLMRLEGTLTICDCQGEGQVTGNSTDEAGPCAAVTMFAGTSGTFKLYGGELTGDATSVVSVGASTCTANIYGGKITNTAQYGYPAINNVGNLTIGGTAEVTGGSGSGASAVCNNSGKAVLTVQDNASLTSGGNGIENYDSVFITGGTVTGKYSSGYGVSMLGASSSLTISGAPVISGARAELYLRTASGTVQSDAKVDATGYTGSKVLKVAEYRPYNDAYAIKVSDQSKNKFTLTTSGWNYLYKDGGLFLSDHTHSYTYTASDTVITESCSCGHEETATLSVKSDADLTYTGSVIKPATVTYSSGWAGTGTRKPADTAIAYTDNRNAGTATAKLTISGDCPKTRMSFHWN